MTINLLCKQNYKFQRSATEEKIIFPIMLAVKAVNLMERNLENPNTA